LARWKLLLQEYTFEIKYKPGKDNINADILSRIELECSAITLEDDWYNDENIKELQSKEEYIKVIKEKINKEGNYNGYCIKEGIVFKTRNENKPYDSPDCLRLMVPKCLISEVLTLCHDDMSGAHLGLKKTIHKICLQFYWRGMIEDITEWIKACSVCAGMKAPFHQKAELHPITEAEQPFDMIGIDFVGPLPKTDDGNRWLLVITDYATRWAEAFATKDSTAITVADILIKKIITRHGAPRKLLSDQGQAFLSKVVTAICDWFKIKKVNTTAYHPQCNGLCEHVNGQLCKLLASYCNERQTDWDQYVDICLFAYRVSKQETIKESPFRLLYGRDANLPGDIAKWSTSDIFIDKISQAWKLAANLLKKAAEQTSSQEKEKKIKYQIGDRIRVENPVTPIGLKKKLRRNLWFEPVDIIDINENSNVLVKHHNKEKWVHENRIKPAETTLKTGRISRPPTRFQAGY
jgi:hypothetical protein